MRAGWNRLYATLGLCALAGMLFAAFVHIPMQEATVQAEAQAAEAREEYARIANFKNEHLDMAAYERELSEHESRGERALPSELEQGAFLRSLQRAAMENGIVLQKVSPEDVQAADGLRALPVNVAFQCDYFALLGFLQELQHVERFVRVKEMKMTEKDGRLDCTVQLIVYAAADGLQEEAGLIYPHE